MKLTIEEYSKRFKMSKEMIQSKLRAKKLDYIIEDSVTYIIVEDEPRETVSKNQEQNFQTDTHEPKTQQDIQPKKQRPKTTVATVIALYQRENMHLKAKIAQLEAKIDKLIDDKEQMLREERDKIEELYSKKDAQLKNILELINTKMMLEKAKDEETIHEVHTLEKKEQTQQEDEIVELKAYLKKLNLKSYQKKVIKRRFLAAYDSDVRVIHKDGKFYLDFSKYDYSDLLSY